MLLLPERANGGMQIFFRDKKTHPTDDPDQAP